MPTVTATGFNTEGYVLVTADWTDVPEVTHAAMTRRNTVTGETVVLRPHVSFDADGFQALNCGIGIWWDTEAPLNVELEYCTTAADVETIINANPGFETGVVPWDVNGATLAQSALNVHSGSFSGLITANGGTAAEVYQFANTPLVAGVPVTVSGWFFAAGGWNAVRMVLEFLQEDGIFSFVSTDIEILDDGEYRYVELTFTPRAAIVQWGLLAQFVGAPAAATVFHLDDIQLTQAQAVDASACDTVTLTSEDLFLKNPLHPCLDVTIGLCEPPYLDCVTDSRISYGGMDDDEFDANSALLFPVNRRRPIAVNRERRDARSLLRLITHDCDARDDVLALNQPGDPLLFQDGSGDYCIEDRYMSVGTVAVRRIGVDQRNEFRLIELPYAVVDRPEGPADGPCGTRFEDLCDLYTSWAALEISDLDWIDLPTGGASDQSPGNEPPAAARTWDDVEAEFVDWDDVEAGGTRDWDELRDGL